MANTSQTMFNSNGKSGHPCLVLYCRVHAFKFSSVRMMFAVNWSYMAFLYPCMHLLCLLSGGFLFKKIWILSKATSASIQKIIWFLSFTLLMYIPLTYLWLLKKPWIFGIKYPWSWCIILLLCCWIQFARILLRIFASAFVRFIGLQFSFLWHLCLVLVLGCTIEFVC